MRNSVGRLGEGPPRPVHLLGVSWFITMSELSVGLSVPVGFLRCGGGKEPLKRAQGSRKGYVLIPLSITQYSQLSCFENMQLLLWRFELSCSGERPRLGHCFLKVFRGNRVEDHWSNCKQQVILMHKGRRNGGN